ncbi:MAG: EF-hand domain-containing protein, partial [Brevundimonas sp.]
MNRTRLLAGLAAASLMLIAGAASAQDARPGLMRADTNGDSRLSKAEFVEARIAPLIAMDADRDGAVTPAERAAARQARVAAAATRRFDKLDA